MSRLLAQLRGQVIGIVALCVALSGTAYAAFALPPNSVGTGVIKNNSLTGKDVKNGSLTKSDLKRGTLKGGGSNGSNGSNGTRGPKGDQGDKGDQGEPGTARAYGTISSTGTLIGPSLNVSAVSRTGAGQFCFHTTNGLTPANAVALADPDYTPIGTANGYTAHIQSSGGSCPAGSWGIRTYNTAGTLTDAATVVMVP
jgi:hypothetical protein